jgi:hypothetical protein
LIANNSKRTNIHDLSAELINKLGRTIGCLEELGEKVSWHFRCAKDG